MKRNATYLVLVIFLAVAVAGWSACTPAKTKAPEKSSGDAAYDLEQEGQIPPPVAPDAPGEPDVEEMPVPNEDIEGENVIAPKDTTKTGRTGAGPAGVSGKDGGFAIPVYRVQVIATSNEQTAMDIKKRVEDRLGFPAYISLVDGMYKVRVGDCTSREEAEKVRNSCRGAGYTDAWIVTDVLKGE